VEVLIGEAVSKLARDPCARTIGEEDLYGRAHRERRGGRTVSMAGDARAESAGEPVPKC